MCHGLEMARAAALAIATDHVIKFNPFRQRAVEQLPGEDVGTDEAFAVMQLPIAILGEGPGKFPAERCFCDLLPKMITRPLPFSFGVSPLPWVVAAAERPDGQ